MPITTIPARYRPGIVKITQLDDRKASELAEALTACLPTKGFNQFLSAVLLRLKDWKREDLHDILWSLYSLSLAMADQDISADEFVVQLTNVMRSSDRTDLKISEESEIAFSSHLKRLLSVESLTLSAKALGLRNDYQRSYCDIRILTDIRPVFGSPAEKPLGAFVEHTLKIEYHEDGEHKEFYVALDNEDLGKIRKALDRAESKTAALKSVIRESGIPDFDRS